MNAIEIRGLSKSFRGLYAVRGLNMTVPAGSIYGFIGENGSGKSTTEKLICGHLAADEGEIRLFGKPHDDPGVRARIGALIENAGCFPSSSVYQNLTMQAINLGIKNRDEEIRRVLKIVRMDDSAKIKFKACSLGMKQRVGIAMALLGNPALLVLDEPINGLDAEGMKTVREVLVDVVKSCGCTVLIASHVLGELEKIATHYGVIRRGSIIAEITAEEMEARARAFVSVQTSDDERAAAELSRKYADVRREDGYVRVYGESDSEAVAKILLPLGLEITELYRNKIGLEEYYVELMSKKENG